MTVLSFGGLLDALNNGTLVVERRVHDAVGPASVDLHLGDELLTMTNARTLLLDMRASTFAEDQRRAFTPMALDLQGRWLIQPGAFVLGSSRERITIGDTLTGRVCGVSTLARQGLQVECAGLVDSGFSGMLTWEIVNHGTCVVVLRPGDRIGQLEVSRLDRRCALTYGHVGRYQHQTGPTTARADRRVAK